MKIKISRGIKGKRANWSIEIKLIVVLGFQKKEEWLSWVPFWEQNRDFIHNLLFAVLNLIQKDGV